MADQPANPNKPAWVILGISGGVFTALFALMPGLPHFAPFLAATLIGTAGVCVGLMRLVQIKQLHVLRRVMIGLAVVALVAVVMWSTLEEQWHRQRFVTDARATLRGLPDYIERGRDLRDDYERALPQPASIHDQADPKPGEAWEKEVCSYLTDQLGSRYCYRFTRRMPPFNNPANQRRDYMIDCVDERLTRLQEIDMSLSEAVGAR